MDKEKCIFYENSSCNIYACSCDYAESCKENPDCIIKRLQAENERLKAESENYCIQLQVLAQALEDIRDISNKHDYWRGSLQSATNIINDILDKINSTIGVEE